MALRRVAHKRAVRTWRGVAAGRVAGVRAGVRVVGPVLGMLALLPGERLDVGRLVRWRHLGAGVRRRVVRLGRRLGGLALVRRVGVCRPGVVHLDGARVVLGARGVLGMLWVLWVLCVL